MDNSPTDPTGAESGSEAEKGDRLQKKILDEQVAYLLKTMDEAGKPAAVVWNDDGSLGYLYRPGFVLARDERWEEVAGLIPGSTRVEPARAREGEAVRDPEGQAVRDPERDPEREDDERPRSLRGLTVLSVPHDAENTTTDWLADVDRVLGVGVASPDHIVFVTGPGKVCPAYEPEELDGAVAPYPPITSDLGAGTEVFVSVVDTGWWEDAALPNSQSPWLHGVTGDPETIGDPIRPYAGHGTFVAGVVRTQAPKAQIRVEGFLPLGGAAYESEMVIQLGQALDLSPDIISLSAGCPTREDLPLVSFEVFWEQRLRHQKGTVLVAAAGNDSTRRPFWPAAFPWAVSVGALDDDGTRAWYTNFGSWVDVYALGTNLVNAYPRGTFVCHESPNLDTKRKFNGLAKWSGTSFSTPTRLRPDRGPDEPEGDQWPSRGRRAPGRGQECRTPRRRTGAGTQQLTNVRTSATASCRCLRS